MDKKYHVFFKFLSETVPYFNKLIQIHGMLGQGGSWESSLLIGMDKNFFFFLFIYFLFYFTILYWFCHTLTWIFHGCTWAPHPELPSHTISLDHPRAPAPNILYPASDIDWWFISYLIVYMFQCHSSKSFFFTIFKK